MTRGPPGTPRESGAGETRRPSRTARLRAETLTLVLLGIGNPACLVDAGLDGGPCNPGRVRVDGVCKDIAASEAPATLPEPGAEAIWLEGPDLSRGHMCVPRLETSVVDFGAVAVGDGLVSEIVVSNLGDGPCQITQAALEPGAASELSLVPPPTGGRTVAPGRFESIEVRYRPTLLGVHDARAVVWVSGQRLGPVALMGRGVTPGSTLTIEPALVDFGRRGIDCVDASLRQVRVTNPTSRPVSVVSSVWPPGLFTSPDEGATQVIGASETATVTVGFVPRWQGALRGRLRLDVTGGDARVVPLLGEGALDSRNIETFAGGLRDHFLRAEPIRDSVQVFVDELEIISRTDAWTSWWIDVPARHLHFAELRTPRQGQTVRVEYEQRCQLPSCGDGLVDPGEQCDDGNRQPHDACLNSCETAFCGDGVLQYGVEECEDGNQVNGDGCNWLCTTEWCGNGVREPPEQCDDGARNSDTRRDACRTDCRFPYCGDRVLDDGEGCDDGNADPTDACVHCQWAQCGDGYVFAGVEQCDDGNQNDLDTCRNDCTLPAYTPTLLPGAPAFDPERTEVVTATVVTLPFVFRFLGETVTEVGLEQPGLLVFGAGGIVAPNNLQVGTSSAPNGFIALWWDALDYSTAVPSVALSTLGTAPHRQFAIEVQDLHFQGMPLSAQVILQEYDSSVVVHYRPLVPPASEAPDAGSATVGWESRDGARGIPGLGCSPNCTLADWPSGDRLVYTP